MATETYSIKETSDLTGYSACTLYRHRVGNRIVFDDGRELKVLVLGGKIKVPKIEVAKLLGEAS